MRTSVFAKIELVGTTDLSVQIGYHLFLEDQQYTVHVIILIQDSSGAEFLEKTGRMSISQSARYMKIIHVYKPLTRMVYCVSSIVLLKR